MINDGERTTGLLVIRQALGEKNSNQQTRNKKQKKKMPVKCLINIWYKGF